MSNTGLVATDATGSPTYGSYVSASNILVQASNGDSNTLQSGNMTLQAAGGVSTNYTIAGIDAGNLTTSIDYSVISNMDSSNGYARLDLTSGNLTAVPPRAVLQAYVDYNASPAYPADINLIDLGGPLGSELLIANGNSDTGLGLAYNTIKMFSDPTVSNSYIQLKSIDASTSSGSTLTLGQSTTSLLSSFNLSTTNQTVFSIAGGFTDPIVVRRNISTTTNTGLGQAVGLLENSVVNATTTGTTTLVFTDSFATIVNTPTAGTRIFVLPLPTASLVGYWYAICNKSTAFTIAVQYPAGTLIATIPVAPNATNGGSVARFAVAVGGASYFTSGNTTNATNATNVEITSDNTSGTYYIPFAKTSGTGNKPLFIDDTTGPLTYNPSTAVLSVGTATFTSQITLPVTTAASFATGTLTCNFGSFSTGVFSATLTANMTAISFSNPITGGQYVIYLTAGSTFTIASTLTGARTNYTTAVSVTTTTTALLTVTYDGSRYIIACSAYI